MSVPALSNDVEQAWVSDGGVRRPVTLKSGTAFDAETEAVAGDAEPDDEDDTTEKEPA